MNLYKYKEGNEKRLGWPPSKVDFIENYHPLKTSGRLSKFIHKVFVLGIIFKIGDHFVQ